jgi:hypothetical protein
MVEHLNMTSIKQGFNPSASQKITKLLNLITAEQSTL